MEREKQREDILEPFTPLSYVTLGFTFALTFLYFLSFFFPFFSAGYVAVGVNEAGETITWSYTEDRTLITVFTKEGFEIFGGAFLFFFLLSLVLTVFGILTFIKKRRYLSITYPCTLLLFTLSGFLFVDSSILMKVILGFTFTYTILYSIDTLSKVEKEKAALLLVFLIFCVPLSLLLVTLGVAFTPTR